MQPERRPAKPEGAAESRRKPFLREASPGPAVTGPICSCGHGRQAHQHYRRGTDCSLCSCPRFHRSLLARLRRRRG